MPYRFSECQSQNKEAIDNLHRDLKDYFVVVDGDLDSMDDWMEKGIKNALLNVDE